MRDWLAERCSRSWTGPPAEALGRLEWAQALAVLVAFWRWSSWGVYVFRAVGLSRLARRAAGPRPRGARLRARSDALWNEGAGAGAGRTLRRSGRASTSPPSTPWRSTTCSPIQEGETNQSTPRGRTGGGGRSGAGGHLPEPGARYDRLRHGHVDVDRPAVEELRWLVADPLVATRGAPGPDGASGDGSAGGAGAGGALPRG